MTHAAMITANKKKAATGAAFFDCNVMYLTNVEICALQYFRRYEYQQFGTIIHFDR